ncbi:phenoloxidase-activating factor 2-like [Oratosquilla oratoria]|uniref:phenoloxidase-activating factor 2-like n=1 Tax=Oratosquilla oratoria TaxID=337810 RepID=UPI003F7725A9
MNLLGKTIFLLTTLALTSCRAHKVRRQSIDPSNLTDEEFIALLTASITNPEEPEVPGAGNNEVTATGCTCVPFYQCLDEGGSHDGEDIFSVRQGNVGIAVGPGSECADPISVCCNNFDLTLTPHGPTDPVGPTPTITGTCGVRNALGVDTTIAGFRDNQTQFGEFPWMTVILTKAIVSNENTDVYVCGGSLIHPSVILTAAHCVHDKSAQDLLVRVGDWNLAEPTETQPHQELEITSILPHPRFHPRKLWNDVALLFLTTPAVLGRTVATACLPQPTWNFDGSRCFGTGWGKDRFGEGGKYQTILKKIDLPVVNFNQCWNALRGTRLGARFRLDQSFLCAGGEPGRDMCKGDGGSPLVCPRPDDPSRYAQVGVVAWGIDCGQPGIPGVFGSVVTSTDWVRQEVTARYGPEASSFFT